MATKHQHDHAEDDLSANEVRVLEALRDSKEPMSAYAILDRVRPSGISHPPTVYRALAGLESLGMVHRLKSLSAFVACGHGRCGGRFAFAFCRQCQRVEEISLDDEHYDDLVKLVPKDIHLEQTTLEFAGLCSACQAAA
ncbi:Zinc uptake regulation protein [Methyloligella halotolerans]|uniref:Zinc uptake regulation protein n=1 Tax=Methyloligella halotolerans TaxID=1177755 RepID=A0A1E2RVS8_9HYPH|nr:transcriptional repressor [Methyloligella halotolerans]ODA66235.1 Zinc uptake regulation protein [Methyloligella halotolerans]